MKKILLSVLLLLTAALYASAQDVNWSHPKYVMNCVMKPRPMVKDTIGVYEYYGDSVVVYHRLDLLKDRYNHKLLPYDEPFRTYTAFDAMGNIKIEIRYFPRNTKTIRFDNRYDTLGRLVEVVQSDNVTKKIIYGRKKIKEVILRPGQAKEIITHHYKDEACTIEKRCVYWEDGYRANRFRFKYDNNGRVRKSSLGLYESDNLYKKNCKFITDTQWGIAVQYQAIIYEWME